MIQILIQIIKEVIKHKIKIYKLLIFRAKWRLKNKENRTIANTIFDSSIVSVGAGTYGRLNIHTFGTNDEGIEIGLYCSIAENVHFFLGGEHDYRIFSTFPFRTMYGDGKIGSISNGKIVIEDDVWIGFNSIILSGVKIGKGAVIAAGSIVTKDVPKYSIWIGNKVIKQRFSKELINQMDQINYKLIDPAKIAASFVMTTNVSEDNICNVITCIKNMYIL